MSGGLLLGLISWADESLLTDPAAQPLAGCDAASTVLVNSTKDGTTLQSLASSSSRLLVADFTSLVLQTTQTLASLSSALGVVATRLVGLTLADALVGLEEELATTHLAKQQMAANLQLAPAAYLLADAWAPVQERADELLVPATALAEVTFAPPRLAVPSIYAVGNSPERKTGNWRQFRPVLHPDLCTRCWTCFVRCPEAAITLDANDYPVVDYDECKGLVD